MISKHKIDVLYIHPSGNPSDYNIPMGVIGLMNSINYIKSGKMCFEVTNDIISNTKIIVMDCHWYFSLFEIARLAKEFKKINSNLVIIVGGNTATIFSEMIVDRFKVDYVIKGDAEVSFPLLIKALLEGKNIHSIPNIVSRNFITPQSYKLTEEDYSKSNCITIDWFPTFNRRMKIIQNKFPFLWNENLGLYPFIPVFKGCNYDCKFCYASKTLSFAICRRGLVSRTAESVIDDLLFCSKQKDIKQVYMVADFISTLGVKFADKIFSQKYDLNLHYAFDFFSSPSIKMLEKMLFSFHKCELFFIFSEYFHRGSVIKRYNYLAETFDYLRRYEDKIKLNLFMMEGNRIFGKLYTKLAEIYKGLNFMNHREWFINIPYPNNSYKPNIKEYFNTWIKKSRKAASKHFVARSKKDDTYKFYLELASEYMVQKIFNKAIHYYRQALNLDPSNGVIYLSLARVHFSLKQYEEGIEEANKALELGYKEGNIHLVLGLCYKETKQYKKAIEELKKAEKINPVKTQINFSLSDCYRNIDQIEQANKELDRGLLKFKKFQQVHTP